jgi:hypothetical protein
MNYILIKIFAKVRQRHILSLRKKSTETIACSFKLILKVGVEKSIVNAPRFTDHGSAV